MDDDDVVVVIVRAVGAEVKARLQEGAAGWRIMSFGSKAESLFDACSMTLTGAAGIRAVLALGRGGRARPTQRSRPLAPASGESVQSDRHAQPSKPRELEVRRREDRPVLRTPAWEIGFLFVATDENHLTMSSSLNSREHSFRYVQSGDALHPKYR